MTTWMHAAVNVGGQPWFGHISRKYGKGVMGKTLCDKRVRAYGAEFNLQWLGDKAARCMCLECQGYLEDLLVEETQYQLARLADPDPFTLWQPGALAYWQRTSTEGSVPVIIQGRAFRDLDVYFRVAHLSGLGPLHHAPGHQLRPRRPDSER